MLYVESLPNLQSGSLLGLDDEKADKKVIMEVWLSLFITNTSRQLNIMMLLPLCTFLAGHELLSLPSDLQEGRSRGG
jgi:hypothetical protein